MHSSVAGYLTVAVRIMVCVTVFGIDRSDRTIRCMIYMTLLTLAIIYACINSKKNEVRNFIWYVKIMCYCMRYCSLRINCAVVMRYIIKYREYIEINANIVRA